MNRLIKIYGCVLLSSTAIAAVQQSTWESSPIKETLQHKESFENLMAAIDYSIAESDYYSNSSNVEKVETKDLDISKIEYIEEEVIELGFDPYDYLPENFSPYTFYFDVASVPFIEQEDHSLGFDTAKYLPEGFDAYKGSTEPTSIHFIEEEDFPVDFPTGKYLPKGFSPYEPYFDLNSIRYIEMHDNFDDDFSIPYGGSCETEPF